MSRHDAWEHIAALEADNAALRGLLRELEWVPVDGITKPARCMACDRPFAPTGHTADCRLDAALEEKE